MKKFLLPVFAIIMLVGKADAQTISLQADTMYFAATNQNHIVYNDITPSADMKIKWKVIATNFPSDWLALVGLCDNNVCYSNNGGYLWNSSTNSSGHTQTSNLYSANVAGTYDMQLNLSTTSVNDTGIYYITVQLTNNSDSQVTKNLTFMVSKTLGVNNISNKFENISLYPNPATSNINVVYGAEAGVKNIAVYNLIGKVITYYKPTGNASANLDVSNVPAGIYFIRLMDEDNNVIATRKFTKQ